VGLGNDYYYPISDTISQNTYILFNFKYMKVDSEGLVLNLGDISCSGEGGGDEL
jgi:hypothetical protein